MSRNHKVAQSGHVTPGHLVAWTTDGVIQDAGTPAQPFVTGGLGILSSNTTSFSIANNPVSGAYSSLSLGITAEAANLTVASFGGAAPLPFNIVLNGVTIPFPGPAGPFLSLAGGTITGNLNVRGRVLIGTGTPGNTGSQYGFQTAYDADPFLTGSDARQNMFNANLTYSANTTNIWENLNSFVSVSGPGVATGEINLAHTFLQVNAGAHVVGAEGYEQSVFNAGIIGGFDSYLAIVHNGPTGTAATIRSIDTYLTNDNTASGSIAEWDALNVSPMQGAGSRPTFYNAIRIADQFAGIVTLSGINIGSLGNATPNQLFIQGQDNSSSTFPFVMKNLAGNISCVIDNSGIAQFLIAGVVLGGASINLFVQGKDNSAGTFPVAVKNLAETSLFSVTNSGIIDFTAAGVHLGGSSINLFVQGADNSASTFPVSVKNLAATNLLSVSNAGAAVIGTSLTVPAVAGATNLTLGTGTALATGATTGMILVPSCAGTPSGSVGALGGVAMIYDSSANKIWFGVGGTWKGVAVT